MKKFYHFILVVIVAVSVSGCGIIESMYDDANYESLTNEKGDIVLYSGGVAVEKYEGIKIIYTNANTDALFFKTADGDSRYWQGAASFDME